MLSLVGLVFSHVPTYNGCSDGCCTPPHHHDISQVIYRKGSGGLEIHYTDKGPFDLSNNEMLDVDAVFKHEYDQSTYALYIGCGGCVPHQDNLVIPPVALNGYQPGEVEPFTGTAYRSVFPKAQRKFNTSLLKTCDQGHFTIRLVDFANRTDGSTLIWGAVVGLGESFTFVELLSYPIFVLKNHGDTWNGYAWTVYLIFFMMIPVWWLDRAFGIWAPNPFTRGMANEPRAWLYEFATIAFLGTALEMFTHLCIAQSHAEWGYAFWVGLIGVIIIGNGLPIAITQITWWGMYHRDDNWVISRPWWAPIELLSGLSYFFLFGAGFFIGPTLVCLAAIVRMFEWAGFDTTLWIVFLRGGSQAGGVTVEMSVPVSKGTKPGGNTKSNTKPIKANYTPVPNNDTGESQIPAIFLAR